MTLGYLVVPQPVTKPPLTLTLMNFNCDNYTNAFQSINLFQNDKI